MQPVKIPKLFWIIIIIAVLLNLVTILIALHSPSGKSYPHYIQGPRGEAATVDYDKITSIVKQQIATLPTPHDGKDGQSIVGPSGPSGPTGSQGVPGLSGSNGTDGTAGVQGEPGQPGKSIELRYDSARSQIEWRYEGDLLWATLVQACTLTNTCVSP